jgi:flagellar biosynthesis GTPase FlhF
MVERGTPGGIVKDAQKFIEWCRQAKHLDDIPEFSVLATTKEQEQGSRIGQDSNVKAHLVERGGPAAAVLTPTHGKAELSPAPHDTQNNGILTSVLNTVAAGMTSVAQSAIHSTTTPPPSDGDHSRPPSVEDVSDDDTASLASFATADSSPELPIRTPSVTSTASNAHLSTEERALQQFLKEKAKLDEKLKKEESRRTEREKKIAEKHMKNMEKQERKYRRALEKANEKRRKEEERREKELQKKLEREERGKRAEIEELKKVVEGLTKDNLALRARIEELEAKGKGKVEEA